MRQQLDRLVRTNQPENLVACGYQKVSVTDAAISYLTPTTGAKYCEISVSSGTTTGFVARYLNYRNATPATLPTTAEGLPLSHGTVFDISNSDSINNFGVIGITGLTCTLYVQYYK